MKRKFEIWTGPGGACMLPHDSPNKKLPYVLEGLTLAHTFEASTPNEAGQKNYDFHGWGKYHPMENWPEGDVEFTTPSDNI